MARFAVVCTVALLALGCGGGDGSDATGELVVGRADGVYAVDLDSGEERRIGPAALRYGAWSASGTKVASGDGLTLVVTTIATGARRRFDARWCSLPEWAPDETALACEYGDPWIVSTLDLATGELRMLTEPSEFGVTPTWSPDSRSIVYAGAQGQGLFVMQRDGRGKRRVAKAADSQPGQGPAWSPDGRSIAYVNGNSVWVVNAEGRRPRLLFDGGGRTTRGLAWSPDGRSIAVTHGDGTDYEIFVADVAGGPARNITDNEGVNDEAPIWSPDSRHVVYLSGGKNRREADVVSVDGGEPSRVSDRAETILHWSPAP